MKKIFLGLLDIIYWFLQAWGYWNRVFPLKNCLKFSYYLTYILYPFLCPLISSCIQANMKYVYLFKAALQVWMREYSCSYDRPTYRRDTPTTVIGNLVLQELIHKDTRRILWARTLRRQQKDLWEMVEVLHTYALIWHAYMCPRWSTVKTQAI